MKTFLLILGLMIGTLWLPLAVSAHQSGCHRWHSCPSDTGSYTCGDLGYYSGCGDYTDYEQPDYAAQGTDNGQTKADTDASYIKSVAESDADEQGHSDGLANSSDDPQPDSSSACDKTFTYASPQPQEYIDAFHDSYLEACTSTYDEAYNDAYESGFQRGSDEYSTRQDTAPQTIETANTSDKSGYWWLVGLGVLCAPAALDKIRKK